MDLTLDPENNTIGGHVEFVFFNDSEEDWDKLCLRDYSSLFIDAKTAGYDGAIETHGDTTKIENITDGRNNKKIKMQRDDDVSVVWLPLESELAPGEKMTLSYDFEAKIPTVADRYGVQDGVYNVTNFYPILAEYTKDGWSHEKFYNCGECFYSEISDYDVNITLPKDMILLTTGLENGDTTDGDKKTQSFHADCVRDFVFSTSKDFQLVEGDFEDVHIRVAYVEENQDVDKLLADESLRASIDSLRIFGEKLGKYPYKDLEVILAPIDAGGMEYPNLIIITKDDIPSSMGANSDFVKEIIKTTADTVVSHEIGHQWFMGIVGSNSGTQPWLDESITSYTEYIYGKTLYGVYNDSQSIPKTASAWDQSKQVLQQNGISPINRSYFEFDQEIQYILAAYNYGKQALIWMGEAIGEEDFYGILREYIQRYAFQNADQVDFFSVVYELAGEDNEELNKVIELFFSKDMLPDQIG